MKNHIAISFENVSKIYNLKTEKKRKQKFYALKNISFTIDKGEVVAVLGTNGSGKSTLSLLLSGISQVDQGKIHINGKQALIAINTGLNQQLSGIENIRLKGALLGLRKKQIDEIIDGVIEFSEIGDFIHQPVKKYSSGMKSRLGFSINLCLNPDIFIIDEALSVGDKAFAKKCINKMVSLKEEGKTIIFVSHSLPQVKSFCTKALWIEGGMMKDYGDINQVCQEYSDYVDYLNGLTAAEKKAESKKKFDQRMI